MQAQNGAVNSRIKIVVVEPDRTRAVEIIDALHEGGWSDVTVLAETTALARRLTEIDPDLVLIDLAHPSRDTLEQLSVASDARGRPVAMFVDRSDDEMTKAAIAAGLSAYVVGGLQKARIKPVLETAIARFQMMSQMRSELDAAKQALEDRKTLDRAKGIMMRAKGISEDEAYQLLRKTAMDQGRKVIDVAQALVTASELLG
ncbi:ANTAR domain-containing response regulator [Yoonia sp. SS1-5]|uniref:ANTAR domain-containing response regulator n=1 Tax=Yoonia rhodophyticola TaxID=3137370 RepID=A0AAN0MMJ5_9RHOB